MFGGLAFLVGGHIAVAASSHGGLLVRTSASEAATLVAGGSVQPMEMRGRVMSGWLHVDQVEVRSDETLAYWVTLGTTYAGSLPAKH